MFKNIELELRAEVLKENFDTVLNKLKKKGNLISETNRLSVMFFGKCGDNCFDVRVRIANKESEVVIKKGDLHSHNRIEFSQKISNNQFIKIVKIISQFGFDTKVGERKNINFQFPNAIIISLVKTGDLSYLEIEKMTDELNQEKDKEELYFLAKTLRVEIIENREKFDNFCKRLSETIDWQFLNTEDCYRKLKVLLDKYL